FTHAATISRVLLAGGTPEQLGQYIAQSGTDYSPDGRTIAAIALVRSAQPSVAPRRMLVLLTPGSPPRLIDTNQNFAGGDVRFTRDQSAVAYAVKQKAADQIVIQPLDGSPQRTMTAFTSGRILSFAWSPDGQSLALTRGYTDSDVVLLTRRNCASNRCVRLTPSSPSRPLRSLLLRAEHFARRISSSS